MMLKLRVFSSETGQWKSYKVHCGYPYGLCTWVLLWCVSLMEKNPLKIQEGMSLSEDGATWTGTMSLKELLLVSCYIG